ncbi:hypothetical protein HPA30_10485 [Streptococcus suis]|uniref:Uncharacterized protein n=1 Tax=Streptococcus suis TaxID=1307 RepID=A0A426T2D4_STRSU|nr:hypothetical protein [Streptococcus suis]NQN11956.1 hypothetical protein [Streptococcus suis]RRR43690.1 hypothetical protein EJA00_09845 [Streptococcus suis]HEL2183665.1 hypothetical protein [Streptococcus suis]
MNKIDQLNNIELIDEKSLTNIEGGKGGKVNIDISINISMKWGNVRDTLRGIGDGIFGHRRKY